MRPARRYYYSKSTQVESYISGALVYKRGRIGILKMSGPAGLCRRHFPNQLHTRRTCLPLLPPTSAGSPAVRPRAWVSPTSSRTPAEAWQPRRVHCSRLLRRPPRQDRRVQVRHHRVRPTTILTVRNPPPMLPPSLQLLLDRTLRQMTTHPEHPSAMLSSHTVCCLQGATARTRERRRQLRHRQGGR